MWRDKTVLATQFCLGQLRGLCLGGAIATTAIATLDTPAIAALLNKWRFDPATNQLEISLKEETTPRYFLLTEPTRIVIDLPNTQLGSVQTQQNYSGVVRQIRLSQFEPNVGRIVLELSPDVSLTAENVQLLPSPALGKSHWLLRTAIGASPTAPKPELSTTLPPASFSTPPQTSIVKVPPLTPTTNSTPPIVTPPPVTTLNKPQTIINVPPLQRTTPTIIEFGQPLPKRKPTAIAPTPQTAVPQIKPNLILPAGTLLSLRYSGEKAVTISANSSRQEVLELDEPIYDRTGKVIVPVGTPVIGRFENDTTGTRFIAQAIGINGRNVTLVAQSTLLNSDRLLSQTRLLRDSAIGTLAGILLEPQSSNVSTMNLLANNTNTPATTYLTATEAVTFQPGEIVQIQLTEDLR